jgi:hypothetical protein
MVEDKKLLEDKKKELATEQAKLFSVDRVRAGSGKAAGQRHGSITKICIVVFV